MAHLLLIPRQVYYLALAERLETEFWTGVRLCRLEENRRLFNTVRSRLPWVHLVS
ncbi:MAG: hypothetical protein KME42_15465 [Tildeniella nuda ZEHNDER 1965/U140]|nr:hypothetical protein [Tildeniella nuda ZEHNDER 1965/U140]